MKLLFLTIIISFSTFCIGQQARLKHANELLQNKSFFLATQAYEDVLERGIDSNQISADIALAYDKTGDYKKALSWYKFIYLSGNSTKNQTLRYILLEKRAQNYNLAYGILKSYLSSKTPTDYELNLALNFYKFEELSKENELFNVQTEMISTEHSEIGISYFDESSVIFSKNERSKTLVNHVHSWTGSYFYNLYKAEINENENLTNVTPIKSNKKSKFHDGIGVYSKTYNTYFLTRNYSEKTKHRNNKDEPYTQIRLEIYTANVDDDQLKNLKSLSKINSRKYSTCHPTLDTVNNRLIFSSNRPGGYGGMDLYYVQLNKRGDIEGKPINFGPEINTMEDEIFPHLNSKEQILFFSTEGHYGLGGLDIFGAKLNSEYQTVKLQNLGAPINSNEDDFSYVNNQDSKKGYFNSNRAGNDDIYSFDQLNKLFNTPLLTGKIYNGFSTNFIANATVYLLDKKGQVIDSTYSDLNGKYNFKVEHEQIYRIKGMKKGMIPDEKMLITNKADYYTVDLNLNTPPYYLFTGIVIDQETKQVIPDVSITLVDSLGTVKVYNYNGITGDFIIDSIPYQQGDLVDFTFIVSAPGYFTRYIPFNDTLAERQCLFLDNQYEVPLIRNEHYEITNLFNLKSIYFDFDKHNIRLEAADELDKIENILKQHPEINLYIHAHTDTRGTDSYNLALSRKRAESSKQYLIKKGISASRLKIDYFGEKRLHIPYNQIQKVKNEVEKERLHQLNRRVEFVIENN